MAAIPFVKDIHFTPGAPDEVAPGVRRVIANNPGPYTYTGSGTYIIGRGSPCLIDPGPDDAAHVAALGAALKGEKLAAIFITHTHIDHCGGAKALQQITDAPIYAYGPHKVRDRRIDAPALDEGADYGFRPDETLADGESLEGDDWRIEAVHTPGHLSNHLCFALPQEKALFTGDHIMGWATTVVAPPDGDMDAYMKSLDKLLARDDEIYFPTHGAPIERPRRFVRAVRTHRLMRDAQILEQIKAGRTTIKEIVPAMYAEVDPRLHKAAALNVLAHLIRLEKRGDVKADRAPDLGAEFALT